VTARYAEIEPSLASSAAIALRMLVVLQMQLIDLRRSAAKLDAAVGCKSQRVALEGIVGVSCAFERIAVAYARLRTHVVAFDGAELGDTVESLGELAIRAEMFVVAVQLSRLGTAIGAAVTRGEAGADRARRLFDDRFDSINDVAECVLREFGRINALWVPHRKASQAPGQPHPTPEDRARRYRAGIRDAQRALTILASESNLAPFLRAGAACSDWLDVQSAASLIAIALQINLTVEPDLSLVSAGAVPMVMRSRNP
jgi:hypothetical protein